MKAPKYRITADTIGEALAQMKTLKSDYGYYVSDEGYQGVVTQESLEQALKAGSEESDTKDSVVDDVPVLSTQDLLENVLPETLDNAHPLAVVSEDGKLEGQLSRGEIAKVLGNN